ncbi:MAG TPA: hypothetical protein V6D10_12700 [Trichocoleus sp.]|jgi:ABC-type transporter Mla subunit MlaD
MNSRSNLDSAAQSPKSSAQATSNQAASVPISVYRELAAELQATQAMLDTVHAKNQQLTQQNQQLRYEIDRFVQSALHLRQVAEPASSFSQSVSQPVSQPVAAPEEPEFEDMAAKLRSANPVISEELFTEEPARPQQISKTAKPKDLGGIWLTLTVIAIIFTAFGAGFLVVKPLLPSR